jgi:hypothetical protein
MCGYLLHPYSMYTHSELVQQVNEQALFRYILQAVEEYNCRCGKITHEMIECNTPFAYVETYHACYSSYTSVNVLSDYVMVSMWFRARFPQHRQSEVLRELTQVIPYELYPFIDHITCMALRIPGKHIHLPFTMHIIGYLSHIIHVTPRVSIHTSHEILEHVLYTSHIAHSTYILQKYVECMVEENAKLEKDKVEK